MNNATQVGGGGKQENIQRNTNENKSILMKNPN
jgi:hypothetical protein